MSDGRYQNGTSNDNRGPGSYDSRVFFSPESDGTYYISASADIYTCAWATGPYELSVTDVTAVDDYVATTETTGMVGVGGSVTGEIESAGDHDWFAVSLEAGKTYRIDLEGSSTTAGTLSDPYLHGVHDANGNLLPGTTDDDGGTDDNSQVTFTATQSTTYYVAAGASQDHEGTYTLSLEEVL